VAVPVGPVGAQERVEVELVDDVQDEPGQVIIGRPVAQVGWEQEGLVVVAAQEVVGHGSSYPFATIAPNVLVLKSLLCKGWPVVTRRDCCLLGVVIVGVIALVLGPGG
jgi:hypothetical protein